jgi:hypothetical protein
VWAAGLGVVMAIKAVVENMYFFEVIRAGWTLRSAVTTAIYRKALRYSHRHLTPLSELSIFLNPTPLLLCPSPLSIL